MRLGLGAAELQGVSYPHSLLREPGHELCSPAQLSAQKSKEETQKKSGSKEVIAPGVQPITSVRERAALAPAAAGFSDLSLWSRVSTR